MGSPAAVPEKDAAAGLLNAPSGDTTKIFIFFTRMKLLPPPNVI